MTVDVETVVVGAGQAGLAVSYHLRALGREHLVIERAAAGGRWHTDVWESFRLVTPNWTLRLPGLPYDGPDPDGFLTRAEVAAYLERYREMVRPPLRTGVNVERVRRRDRGGVDLETSDGPITAGNVVIACGSNRRPQVPECADRIDPGVLQLHSSRYRSPRELPAGAVLVVGAGQSGVQIGAELLAAGRPVTVAVGRHRSAPRRYRGRDIVWWLDHIGALDHAPGPNELPAAHELQLAPTEISLAGLADRGARLVGRILNADGSRIRVAGGLGEVLRRARLGEDLLLDRIDEHVERDGPDAPPDDRDPRRSDLRRLAAAVESRSREIDLGSDGIGSVIWATGYRPDLAFVDVPTAGGRPVQRRGVTAEPGIYVVGLKNMHAAKSDLLLGVGDDAAHVAGVIAGLHSGEHAWCAT